MSKIYTIKKKMLNGNGQFIHVLLTNGQSEILELTNEKEAKQLVEILNTNSDSGWVYSLMSTCTT